MTHPHIIPLVLLGPPGIARADEGTRVPLKGDFHSHSHHSDGDSSLRDLVARARTLGLDFLSVTDHDDHQQGEPRHWSDPEHRSEGLTLIPGIEWSSTTGHANILHPTPFRYGAFWEANRALDGEGAARRARELGLTFSVNHPMAYRVLDWRFPTARVDLVEVWNGVFDTLTGNLKAVREYWEPMLISGKRVSAIGGSDLHNLKSPWSTNPDLGVPTTWVWSADRSARAILAAAREGRASISYTSAGERVEMEADLDGNGSFETGMGSGGIPRRAIFRVKLSFLRNAKTLRWIADGTTVLEQNIPQGRSETTLTWELGTRRPRYVRVEVHGAPLLLPSTSRSAGGTLLALGNPIYISSP